MKVQELFSDRSKWTQGRLARDVNGVPCSPRSTVAVSWCLFGALDICYPSTGYNEACSKLYDHCSNPVEVNDEEGYEAVMEIVKRANL